MRPTIRPTAATPLAPARQIAGQMATRARCAGAPPAELIAGGPPGVWVRITFCPAEADERSWWGAPCVVGGALAFSWVLSPTDGVRRLLVMPGDAEPQVRIEGERVPARVVADTPRLVELAEVALDGLVLEGAARPRAREVPSRRGGERHDEATRQTP